MTLSPNHGERRGGLRPDLVVLHYTAMASAREALERLCDPDAEVSAHYLIAEDGDVVALVPEERRAWHAGAGRWGDVRDINSRSIGIELANRGTHPFSHVQMTALERLLGEILPRWSISPERVIGHSDMTPARKKDPGPRFDWRRLAQAGLSIWPDEGVAEVEAFSPSLRAFGYDPAISLDLLLDAFRWRFRPWATGPLSPRDAGAALDLGRRFPVDRGAGAA
ncbi:N-acetylmuramoyl-L-alanine amidase [Rubellimicrobium rubrum]|uniref:N-acetylmuramoyl-L-alanine amidase n=1 Tax=Rubellimicrobium rubrum TaxID=2585369 RepID=A0A5C4N2X9_9RHOB|nr:N-acetylmuramoyl-L-alanine amidase [Rubellimicrobium rubrum]TNC51842.1 N-acetylmuramoyl-L-alanine amidase [Rubellimicrobium rubrum]